MVDIRRVTPAEWPILARVRLGALRDAPYAFGSTYEREADFTEQDWLGRMSRAAYFVACDPAADPAPEHASELASELASHPASELAPDPAAPVGLAGAFAPAGRPQAREIVAVWVLPDRRGGKLAD